MQLGLLTACFADRTLAQVAVWASAHGFGALEVAAWPRSADRAYAATHIDVEDFGPGDAERTTVLLIDHELELSSLAYYENNLHPDPVERERINAHLRRCIDAAALLGCPTVGTFIGRDPASSVRDNLREADRVFRPLVNHAGEHGVTLVIENCPMQSWHPDGYPANLAYSPELWDWLVGRGLALNFDPSHLPPLGIDPLDVLGDYCDHIAHVQAKDVELFPAQRNRYGYHGKTYTREDPGDAGWWRYRVPGLGQIDWRRVIDLLYQGGFGGAVSIEHEDPVWSGDYHRVSAGLEIARRTLAPLIVA
jgi:sugar phosphate isomerase/epimerase